MGNDKRTNETQIHAGRRGRLRKRFTDYGLATFNECEVIEFALGFCLPRIDTNPIAHRLINKFGSILNIIDASAADLSGVVGMGENASVFLSFLKQWTTYIAEIAHQNIKINSVADALAYLAPLMKTFSVEQLAVLCLDRAGRVLVMDTVTDNELDRVNFNIRHIARLALRVKTATVIIAHNHLNENPSPSKADFALTRQLAMLFCAFKIDLADHIIFAGEKYYSFSENGTLDVFKKEFSKTITE
jgi:DNA repair protein RadC